MSVSISSKQSKAHSMGKYDNKAWETQESVKHSLSKLGKIYDSVIWQSVFSLIILINICDLTFQYTFVGKPLLSLRRIVYEAVFLVHLAMRQILIFSNRVQITMRDPPNSKKMLIVDYFLAVPYALIYDFCASDWNHLTAFAIHHGQGLRIIHVFLLFYRKSNRAGMNHWIFFFALFTTTLFFFIHYYACIWYLMGEVFEESWITTSSLNITKITEDCWCNWYLMCLLLSVGYTINNNPGNLHATNYTERLIAIFAMCFGFVLTTGILIGSLQSRIANGNFKRLTEIRTKRRQIKKFFAVYEISDEVSRVIDLYFSFLWEKKKGVADAKWHMMILPSTLRNEICLDINIRPLLSSILFKDKPEALLRTVAMTMKHEFYQPGEMIYYRNCVINRMVFVVVGTIEILSDEDDESPIIQLGPGTLLGEVSLLCLKPSKNHVRCATYAELQVLYRRNFMWIVDLFPLEYRQMQIYIMIRIAETKRRKPPTNRVIRMNIFLHSESEQTSIKILKDKLRGKLPQDANDKYLVYYKLAGTSVEYTGKTDYTKRRSYLIRPNSAFLFVWEIIIIVTATFIAIMYPYCVAFRREFPDYMKYGSYYFEMIFVVDIVLMAFTVIEKVDVTVVSFHGILREKVRTVGFYLDIISAFYLEKLYTHGDARLFYLFKLNRVLKCYRVCRMFERLEHSLESPTLIVRLVKYAVYIIVCTYWLAVLLYMTSCFYDLCYRDSWFFRVIKNEVAAHTSEPLTEYPATYAIYLSMTIFGSTATGDPVPGCTVDFIVIMLIMCLGCFVYSYCIAELAATFTNLLAERIQFQESYFSVKKFMIEKKIQPQLRSRVLRFFKLQWFYNKGNYIADYMQGRSTREEFFTKLKVRHEAEYLKKVLIFKHTSYDFLLTLARDSQTIILPPGEILCQKGETLRIVFVILEGFCIRIHDVHQYVMGPFSCFGFLIMLTETASLGTVKTLTNVKLLCIPQKSLVRSLTMFPLINRRFRNAVQSFDFVKEEQIFHSEEAVVQDEKYIYKDRYLSLYLDTSIVNLRRYCRINGESYMEPYKEFFSDCLYPLAYFVPPICLTPYGMVLKVWVTIRVVAIVLMAFTVPLQQVAPTAYIYLNYVIMAMDIIAYIDLVVMMFVAYYGPKNNLIMHPTKTVTNYLKGRFFLDLGFTFPWDKLVPWRNLGLIKLIQIYKVLMYFGYITEDIDITPSYIVILKFFIITLIMGNFWASAFVYCSCTYYDPAVPESVAAMQDKSEYNVSTLKPYIMYCDEDSWIDKSKYGYLDSPFAVFIFALYYCTSTLICCGFGDIQPSKFNEIVFSILMILMGLLYFGYMYASISSFKVDANTLHSRHQHLMNKLTCFLKRENVPKPIGKRVINSLEYCWQRNYGAEPNDILSNLYSTLHEDLIFNMYEDILRKVTLFEDADDSFIKILGKELHEVYFYRQEIIFRAEDVVDNVFIIYKGAVELVSFLHDVESLIGPGGIFGSLTANFKSQMSMTITALNNVDCVYISTEKFFSIVEKFPKISSRLQELSKHHLDFIINTTYLKDVGGKLKKMALERSTIRFGSLQQQLLIEDDPYEVSNKKISQYFLLIMPWKWFRTAMHPRLYFFVVFDSLTVFMTLCNYTLTTYHFVFQDKSLILIYFAIFSDVFFFAKVFYDVHKAYENNLGGLETNNKEMLKRYFCTQKFIRVLQIVTNLPIAYFMLLLEVEHPDTNFYFSSLRLITILRFVYVYLYYRERKNKLLVNKMNLVIVVITVSCLFVIHSSACVWYLISCPITYCIEGTWGWNLDIISTPKWAVYLRCLYYNVEIISTTGTGDVLPDKHYEIQATYVLVIMSMVNSIIGVFIGEIVNAIDSYVTPLSNYEYKIATLRWYLKNLHLSDYQMSKMWTYVEYLWNASKGGQSPVLLSKLHYTLRKDLMYEIYGHHLRDSYIFGGTEDAFQKQLCLHFVRTVLFEENYIVQSGDSDKSMYFIHLGEVDIVTVEKSCREIIHDTLHTGDMFGLIQGMYHGIPHHFAFKARTTVHVISLCLNDWEDLLSFFPRSKEIIYDRTQEHYSNVTRQTATAKP